MADNDIELDLGVNFDESKFETAYGAFLNKLSEQTRNFIGSVTDDMKGAAAKNWNSHPFFTMHDPRTGSATATQAFLPSFGADLSSLGLRRDSQAYQSAMMSAAYRSTIPDAVQRHNALLAQGKDALPSDSIYEHVLDTDYRLMTMPWSRDFLKQRSSHHLTEAELADIRKLKKAGVVDIASSYGLDIKSTDTKKGILERLASLDIADTKFDFAGMREHAVEEGIGRWIDDKGEHTADNFELIEEELEKIDEKSGNTKKHFIDWGDSLKGVLGTLTAIGSITALGKTFEVAYKAAEAGTVAAGGTLDKRRAFIGMSAIEELQTKVASRSIGLGENAIKSEIYSMADSIEQYKLFGEGDALPSALLGIFGNLMSSDDPFEVYKNSADQIYEELKNADTDTRTRWLMLMNKAGLGTMSSLVGQFLSNPEYAKTYGAPSSMFALKNNPFYSTYSEAEAMLPDLAKLNESLKASYSTMYTAWEKAFGEPFKTWWDNTLKDTIVPWFLKLIRKVKGMETAEDMADAAALDVLWTVHGGLAERQSVIEANADIVGNRAYPYYAQFLREKHALLPKGRWNAIIPTGSIDYSNSDKPGVVANAQWKHFLEIGSYSDEEINTIKNEADRTRVRRTVERVREMIKMLEDTNLAPFLNNSEADDMDVHLLRALQMGIYSPEESWKLRFNHVIEAAQDQASKGTSDEAVIELLKKIAENTELAEAFKGQTDVWQVLSYTYGPQVADEMMRVVNKQ